MEKVSRWQKKNANTTNAAGLPEAGVGGAYPLVVRAFDEVHSET